MDDANGINGTNGTLKANLKASRAANGINGAIKSQMNGHALGPKRTTRPRGPGLLARTFSIAAR
jgi:hypothetical protein